MPEMEQQLMKDVLSGKEPTKGLNFWTGTPGKFGKKSKLRPEQEENWQAYQQAVQGGFQDAADYYRKILMDDPETMDLFFAPEMQKFNRDIMPNLANQFAGLGAGGGITSSGFQQASAAAGADLSERLAGMRANLKQQAASGLSGLATGAMDPVDQMTYQQPQEGFLQQAAPIIGSAISSFAGPPGVAAAANTVASQINQRSPYGKTIVN